MRPSRASRCTCAFGTCQRSASCSAVHSDVQPLGFTTSGNEETGWPWCRHQATPVYVLELLASLAPLASLSRGPRGSRVSRGPEVYVGDRRHVHPLIVLPSRLCSLSTPAVMLGPLERAVADADLARLALRVLRWRSGRLRAVHGAIRRLRRVAVRVSWSAITSSAVMCASSPRSSAGARMPPVTTLLDDREGGAGV